jgi:hypothetical protein
MRIASVLLTATLAGCSGSGQITSWTGTITLVANGTLNGSGLSGTETLNAKCLLQGTAANIMVGYTLDSTQTTTDGGTAMIRTTGNISGNANLTGSAASTACQAFLNSYRGQWTIAIDPPASITGTFTTTGPSGPTMTTSDWTGEDPWQLKALAFSTQGLTSTGTKPLSGMQVFQPPGGAMGTGDITMTWAVTPQ